MKKKSLFLLASMLMAGGLVGGTFALWAVTDNADPFDIKVSTGSIVSDATKYLTLEWGDSTVIGNVSGLKQNEYRKASVLDLKYEHNEAQPDDINGVLTMQVTATGVLAEKLHVEAYKGSPVIPDTDGVISASDYAAAQSKKLTFVNNESTFQVTTASTLVTIVAYLDSSTDAADMEEMTSLQATVTFDWDLLESDKVEAHTIYASGFYGAPSVYAWNASGKNGNFPGIEMTPVTGKPGLYTAQVKTSYTKMIISGKLTSEGNRVQTDDIIISETITGLVNWFAANTVSNNKLTGSWSELADGLYFLVGKEFEDWKLPEVQTTRYALELDETVYKATVTLGSGSMAGENQGFKVYQPFSKTWYGVSTTNTNNMTVESAGNYEVTFDPAGPTYITVAAI